MESNKTTSENETPPATKPSEGGYVECLKCGSIYLPTYAHKCTKERIAQKAHDMEVKKDKKRLLKSEWYFIIVVGLLLFLWLSSYYREFNSVNAAQFQPHIDKYVIEAEAIINQGSRQTQEMVLGPILIINKDSNTVAKCFHNYPEDIVAKNPEEVQTLVMYNYEGIKEQGRWLFDFGHDAIDIANGVYTWREVIVDLKRKTVISSQIVTNHTPEFLTYESVDFRGIRNIESNRYKELRHNNKSYVVEKIIKNPCLDTYPERLHELTGYPETIINPFYSFEY